MKRNVCQSPSSSTEKRTPRLKKTNKGTFITLVTHDAQLVLTPSDLLLKNALESIGCRTRTASWSDPNVDWSLSPLSVLRSAWDSFTRPDDFKAWLDEIENKTILVNRLDLVRWNFDKRYLIALAEQGVAVSPLEYLTRGSSLSKWKPRWNDVVLKPIIGGNSYGVRRFQLPQSQREMELHLAFLLTRTGVLIQRYEPTVWTKFERSLVFIAGNYSHAVRRIPFNTGNTPDSPDFDHIATDEEIHFSLFVLKVASALGVPYARVDLLPTYAGLVLMELELIDPAIFLTRRPLAALELAAALTV